jgi:hypothetical protein
MGNLTEGSSFLSRHWEAFVPVYIVLFGVCIWLLRGLIMCLSPTLALKVLKDPTICIVQKDPVLLVLDPPVYLVITFEVRSWLKDDYWRMPMRLLSLGVGGVTCDIYCLNSHLSLRLPERLQFADKNYPNIESTIIEFRYKLADSNKEPGQIVVKKIQLEMRRMAERPFRYTFSPAENQQMFKWGSGS